MGRRWKISLILFAVIFFSITFFLSSKINGILSTSLASSDNQVASGSLAILILSTFKNNERRRVIRETWVKLKPTNSERSVENFFVIGVDNLSYEQRRLLLLENSAHNDMLLLSGTTDDYESLTRKVKVALRWIHYNAAAGVTYVLKVDDDSFVQVPQLMQYLEKLNYQERLYLGFFYGRGRPRIEGKWAEPNWFLCSHYLPHARGGGYILSRDLVKFIVDNFHLLTEYANEDVSVGTWLAPFNIRRIHEPLFDVEYRSRGCHNGYLVSHKLSIVEMRKRFSNLRRLGTLCEKEQALHPSYRYNWSVNPINCCERTWKVP